MTPSARTPEAESALPRVVGAIPAAGSSTRMGTPKGLLELGGATFARRVVSTLREGGCEPVLFVARPDDEDAAVEARAAGATVLHNHDPGAGPITSLRVALEAVDGSVEHLVWLPLDHPEVRPETVAALIREARAHRAPVALPVHRGRRGHPAVFARAVFDELLDPALEGGARTVVHRHLGTARLVETTDAGVLIDVDTPAEYRSLLDAAGGAGGDEP